MLVEKLVFDQIVGDKMLKILFGKFKIFFNFHSVREGNETATLPEVHSARQCGKSNYGDVFTLTTRCDDLLGNHFTDSMAAQLLRHTREDNGKGLPAHFGHTDVIHESGHDESEQTRTTAETYFYENRKFEMSRIGKYENRNVTNSMKKCCDHIVLSSKSYKICKMLLTK